MSDNAITETDASTETTDTALLTRRRALTGAAAGQQRRVGGLGRCVGLGGGVVTHRS